MKEKIFYILFSLVLVSCNQIQRNENPKIEIYLTKSRIESYQGNPITKSIIDSLNLNKLGDRFDFNIIRLDTLNDDFVFAGEFKAEKSNLKEKPIINNSDIQSFNTNNGKLVLNSAGARKLSKLDYVGYGKQFVLYIDGNPKLNGYFFSPIYSYWCSTYHYPYIPNEDTKILELAFGKDYEQVNFKQTNMN